MARLLLALLAASFPSLAAGEAAREIIRRSAVLDERNLRLARNYTFTQRLLNRVLDGEGREKCSSSKTYDITFLFGVPYRRLIAENDRPLSPAREKQEQEKLAKVFARRQHESEAQRKMRLAEYRKNRERAWAFLREVPDAFEFRLLGEEPVEGRPAYVIEATPLPGYRPRTPDARVFAKLRGKLWIDKAELQWVKGEAETIDAISFGLFLVRLGRGSRLEFEQMKVNDEVWMPRRIWYEGSGRLALLKTLRAGGEITYDKYRKFQSDSELAIPACGSSP